MEGSNVILVIDLKGEVFLTRYVANLVVTEVEEALAKEAKLKLRCDHKTFDLERHCFSHACLEAKGEHDATDNGIPVR